ncbi:MAG: nitroreductase family deazaflavin-dependent oxidoreductase [Chloroflexota bacterium]
MTISTQTEETARQVFKRFNRFMLLLWRLGLGPWVNAWPEVGGRILVLTHTGRKSGLKHRTPINYAVVDGEIYCSAGFGHITDWYRNILASPQVEVWLPDGWWQGIAEDVSQSEQRLAFMRQVIIASGFAGPLFGVDANSMDDAELEQATRDYRLIHIRRTQPRTGPGGPGELSWIWPLATFILLPLALRRCRRK